MNITRIYNKYKIMPNLQLHQFRVATVAKIISESQKSTLPDLKNIVSAALLHDMGNIIKFDLSLFPEFLEPEGFDYWEKVKETFVRKYGTDEHIATHLIAEEIEVSDRTYELVTAVGFSQSEKNSKHNDIAKKICAYSDHRVSPFGITSLEKRIAEGYKRFQMKKSDNTTKQKTNFEKLASFMKIIESQIFKNCKIKPEDITDENVNPVIEELKIFDII